MSDHPRFRTFLILGAPGSGKGTQGKVLGSIPRFHHLACGDVFRSLDTRTVLGQKFVEYSSRGELVPDDVTVALWRANIKQRVDGHQFKPEIDFLVLDGIPRNMEQAKLKDMLAWMDSEDVAYDIGAYRAAPPGIRIWGGATVESEDMELLCKWLEHGFEKFK